MNNDKRDGFNDLEKKYQMYGGSYQDSSTEEGETFKDIEDDKELRPKKAKKSRGKTLVVSALLWGAIAGGVFSVISVTTNKLTDNNAASNNIATATLTSTAASDSSTSKGMDVEAISKTLMPSMVEITGTTTVSSQYRFGSQGYEASAAGTGTIIGKTDKELLVLTNAHVVESMSNLKVKFVDGKAVSASIKGSSSEADVAVIAIKLSDMESSTKSSISIAQLDTTGKASVGQEVVAIGNADGLGQSVTVGYISAVDRSITIDNTTYSGLYMTDAAINSGNSGGALINSKGVVIGINFAKSDKSGIENMAYTIPISKVNNLINKFMNQETREEVAADKRGYLGIRGGSVSSEMIASGYPSGVLVGEVEANGAAKGAGIAAYDVITEFDGQSVSSMENLQNIMKYYKNGDKVTVKYATLENNEYKEKSTEVTLQGQK